MNWHVVWNSPAERQLQRVISSQPDPTEVVVAAETIERLLEDDPLGVGESREEDERILIHGGYAVLYGTQDDDQIVIINAFWRWAK